MGGNMKRDIRHEMFAIRVIEAVKLAYRIGPRSTRKGIARKISYAIKILDREKLYSKDKG